MDIETFARQTQSEGFSEPVQVERQANGFVDVHTHPFEAKALILSGQIEIGSNGSVTTFAPGEIFHLTHAQPHWEKYGPQGVVYLSARKET